MDYPIMEEARWCLDNAYKAQPAVRVRVDLACGLTSPGLIMVCVLWYHWYTCTHCTRVRK